MDYSEFLPRRFDHLGDLGAKLRDLQGYRTLANELIQNADDASANWMSFDIGHEALVVDNDGVFSECEDVKAPECLWRTIDNDSHSCDFHRFCLIGSGDKRLQEGTTGAFGIGFISVYQLTDQPELISAGRHWTLREERSEAERIAVCRGCPRCTLPYLPGTRFILPFARDEQSVLRQALRAEPVPENVTARLLEELDRSLPVAMLFLKNIAEIEVRRDGRSQRAFERVMDDDRLIISQGEPTDGRVWHLLHGNFKDVAEDLRVRHPGRIEDNRSSEVDIALPIQSELSAGMLCACLPTEESTGLPFHVNANFFPSNDRKHIILGEDYQSQWNREAISAAARTVAAATPQLTTVLGAEGFWHLASTLYRLAQNTTRDGRDGVWREFWGALQEALRKESVVMTSSGAWNSADSGVALLLQREETDNIAVLEGLGIKLVAEDLRPYQPLLRSIGVPVLNVETLCSALRRNGLDKPVCLDDLPPCLASEGGRAALWTEIAILLDRQGRAPHARQSDEERLRTASIAPSLDGSLRPCRDVFSADATTVQLFSSLELDIPFLDRADVAFAGLEHLCSDFEAEDAVLVIEESDPSSIQRLWQEGHLSLASFISWFENRRKQIMDDDDIRMRLSALAIYPSAGQLHSLSNLILPGGFEDPLGLTSLVDVQALGGRRQFLLDLGAAQLDFRAYVLEHLSHAIEDESLDQAVRREAITLIAERFGELVDDDRVHQALSSVRFVICADGEYRRPGDCYFETSIVREVLEDDANIAILPKKREASMQRLLNWLGVANVPRLQDVTQMVKRISSEDCSDVAVIRIQRIVAHLSERFNNLEETDELEVLQSLKWLPARRDRSQWYAPSSLYAPFRSYLFESQGKVLDVPSPNSDFLVFLGVRLEPEPTLVVQHLLHCADRGIPVNRQVYRFLDDESGDPAIEELKSTKCLWLGDAYRSPDHVFWGDHPFGHYRWRLAEDLRGYGSLLEKIGVTDSPDHGDALDVLKGISAEFGEFNRPLDDEAYAVVIGCWQMLEEALDEGAIDHDWLDSLRNMKSIPNKSNVLYHPTWLFFENRVGLADKFGDLLVKNVIPQQLGTGRAFLAAGVQQLGSAVQIEVLRIEKSDNDPDTRERLLYRQGEIARVLFGQVAPNGVQVALGRLSHLNCKSAASIELRYRLDALEINRSSSPELASALYHPNEHSLWAVHSNGEMPWAPLARELAIALCPQEDPGLFAAGLKEVLAASTIDEAATVLNELGLPQINATVVEPPPFQESAHQLGLETDLDDLETSRDDTKDRDHSDIDSGDQTEASTESESPRGEDEPPPQTRKFISYIAVSHDEGKESDPDSATHEERMSLEDKAIELIIGDEPELGRTPTNNPGFDLVELGSDGRPVRWVEVKAMKGTLLDRPVGLSRTQFEWAQEHGSSYWLYVVEGAGNPEKARVIRIQDPAGKGQTFTFDHGWIAVAEDIRAA